MIKNVFSSAINKFKNINLINFLKRRARQSLYKEMLIGGFKRKLNNDIGCIVFSKDRALQLDALLRSIKKNCRGYDQLHVIYGASNSFHRQSYEELKSIYSPWVEFINEAAQDFKSSLINLLKTSKYDTVFFLVDDIVFIREVNFDQLKEFDYSKIIFSMRLGRQLTYSYVVDKPQPLPSFSPFAGNLVAWSWLDGQHDWAYPLSVDGHIFRRLEILPILDYYEYHSPNSMESVIQSESSLFTAKIGVCGELSSIVNIPCNVVQKDYKNRHGLIHQDSLLKIWNEGFEIDIGELQNLITSSVHEEIEFSFKPRT